MEYVFLILALLSAVASVAMLIGNVLNHGLRVLLTIRGVKLPLIFFASYIVCYLLFLFISS